jgi:hypothetical protein
VDDEEEDETACAPGDGGELTRLRGEGVAEERLSGDETDE